MFTPRRLGNWLKAFQDHAHLDSNSPRRFPGTYSAAFGQLNKPYTEYLVDLGTAEKETVQIEVAPRRRLSARELANPFLAKQAMEIYEEVIDPQSVLLRLVTTADVMADTCVEINQCVGCSRHRAGVASMAWMSRRQFSTIAP